MRVNPHLYKTGSYDRSKGVLTRADYLFMRECLENYLEKIQQDFDQENDQEIMQIKLLFIRLDHHIDRLRA
jgi:hypothetical protein